LELNKNPNKKKNKKEKQTTLTNFRKAPETIELDEND